jgi:histidinol phosphatase-like PHP family hydrolase/predicted nuclease with RNAse H fold/dephospho-CoA kinase
MNRHIAPREANSSLDRQLDRHYFRVRDFEYVQPIYDLAFLLEVSALASGVEVPKYRTFSLWRAGFSLDGYGTSIDRWLDNELPESELDFVPSSRINQHLLQIRQSGTLPELGLFSAERFQRALRLRAVRGLGPSKIAFTLSSESPGEDWFRDVALDIALDGDRISRLYFGDNPGPWQTAHVVPPLLRFLRSTERSIGRPLSWYIHGITDPFQHITQPISVCADLPVSDPGQEIANTINSEKHFRLHQRLQGALKHGLGWTFNVRFNCRDVHSHRSLEQIAVALDPMAAPLDSTLHSDLHLHTAWSDGAATVDDMARAVLASGLDFFAVTDHSRSSKLQGGLTPPMWLRQASALTLARPVCSVLHGVEVDVLRDGTLDLPLSLLAAADLVVASIHSAWADDARENTDRLLRAIESGHVDVLAHPTSALVGKPGVPDYVRHPADVYWSEIFSACARWNVALEFNCFPSRLDLPLPLLAAAVAHGCAISLGSDSHARSHLINLKYGAQALRRVNAAIVLNRLSLDELRSWIRESRAIRRDLCETRTSLVQPTFQFDSRPSLPSRDILARTQAPPRVPDGSRIVGIDLTAGDKPTGVALLDAHTVSTCSLRSDADILAYVAAQQPAIVSIDSPLGLPGGGHTIQSSAGIVRVAEHDLASIGIPAYPALIESMEKLTLRGIRLRRLIEATRTTVIESYPGAAQDILCLPRKQRGLELLKQGLSRLGLDGPGLQTRSHDEVDAITAAIVGRYYESGMFEPMGIPSEAQLIVPKSSPLVFDTPPVICLAGRTGVGKSVVARYVSVFYGFAWIRTRDVIRELLIDDLARGPGARISTLQVAPQDITEEHLRSFGSLILNDHGQAPLRESLTSRLLNTTQPVIVDAIRATDDVHQSVLSSRPVLIWFVDCPEGIMRLRLARKRKGTERRIPFGSPVDRTAPALHRRADRIIPNAGSLEELRWILDDALFATFTLLA